MTERTRGLGIYQSLNLYQVSVLLLQAFTILSSLCRVFDSFS